MKKVLITGSAGFIGYHLSQSLLSDGIHVLGYDGLTDYYDVCLKQERQKMLCQHASFKAHNGMLEDFQTLEKCFHQFNPDIVVHLAAQAGVRYSLENPKAYIDSNLIGTYNILELAKRYSVKHLLMASTSSVYGANIKLPFSEHDKTDTPLTLYAATKKSTELIAHSYSHIWNIPITMLRFFTVYGPWGRPDLALYKFLDAMVRGEKIDIYNHGNMYRDFTYIDDLIKSVKLLLKVIPSRPNSREEIAHWDNLSEVAPFRTINIGNSQKVRLIDFIDAIEETTGLKSNRNYMEMQLGDVEATLADTRLLYELTNYRPDTSYKKGITEFVKWFMKHRVN